MLKQPWSVMILWGFAEVAAHLYWRLNNLWRLRPPVWLARQNMQLKLCLAGRNKWTAWFTAWTVSCTGRSRYRNKKPFYKVNPICMPISGFRDTLRGGLKGMGPFRLPRSTEDRRWVDEGDALWSYGKFEFDSSRDSGLTLGWNLSRSVTTCATRFVPNSPELHRHPLHRFILATKSGILELSPNSSPGTKTQPTCGATISRNADAKDPFPPLPWFLEACLHWCRERGREKNERKENELRARNWDPILFLFTPTYQPQSCTLSAIVYILSSFL